ncbi:LOW QUALITY PROTEIN: late cornified envelope protein 2A-like [Megaptera novaeangliae]
MSRLSLWAARPNTRFSPGSTLHSAPAELSCQQNQQQCQPPPKCAPKGPAKCPPKCSPKCPAPCPPPVSCCGPSGCCSSGVSSCSGSGDCCLSHHRPYLFHQRRHQSPDFCECVPSGGTGCCEVSGDTC